MSSLTLATLLIIAFGVLARNGYGRSLALGGITGSGGRSSRHHRRPDLYTVALGTVVALGLAFSATAGRLRRLIGPSARCVAAAASF